MGNTPQRTESITKAMVYWSFSVIGTFFPTLVSVIMAALLSKTPSVGGDELVMLGCLLILPALLDYFRYRNEQKILHAICFFALLIFFAIFMMIYGVYKAQNWTEITPLSCVIVSVSILTTGLAEYSLHR